MQEVATMACSSEFDNGYSVYNNSGAAQTVTFPGGATGVSSNISGARHMLPDSDGEIYLKEGSITGMIK